MQSRHLVKRLSTVLVLGSFSLTALGVPAYCADTTNQITLKRGFFKPLRFTTGESKPVSVYGFSGLSFKPEFEKAMSTCPAALQEARKSFGGNGIALVGSLGMLAVSIKMLLSTLDDANTVNSGRFPDNDDGLGDLWLICGAGAVTIIGGVIANSHLKKSVKIYNSGCVNENAQGQLGTSQAPENMKDLARTPQPLQSAPAFGPEFKWYVGLTNTKPLYGTERSVMKLSDFSLGAGLALGF